jgi:hypothetical protein
MVQEEISPKNYSTFEHPRSGVTWLILQWLGPWQLNQVHLPDDPNDDSHPTVVTFHALLHYLKTHALCIISPSKPSIHPHCTIFQTDLITSNISSLNLFSLSFSFEIEVRTWWRLYMGLHIPTFRHFRSMPGYHLPEPDNQSHRNVLKNLTLLPSLIQDPTKKSREKISWLSNFFELKII